MIELPSHHPHSHLMREFAQSYADALAALGLAQHEVQELMATANQILQVFVDRDKKQTAANADLTKQVADLTAQLNIPQVPDPATSVDPELLKAGADQLVAEGETLPE